MVSHMIREINHLSQKRGIGKYSQMYNNPSKNKTLVAAEGRRVGGGGGRGRLIKGLGVISQTAGEGWGGVGWGGVTTLL